MSEWKRKRARVCSRACSFIGDHVCLCVKRIKFITNVSRNVYTRAYIQLLQQQTRTHTHTQTHMQIYIYIYVSGEAFSTVFDLFVWEWENECEWACVKISFIRLKRFYVEKTSNRERERGTKIGYDWFLLSLLLLGHLILKSVGVFSAFRASSSSSTFVVVALYFSSFIFIFG